MYDVVSIGSTTLDSFWKTNFNLVDFEKTPSGKALLIPFGEKFGTEDVVFSLGGNAANASITFARQWFKTSLFTKIGKDIVGEQIKRWLKNEKVYTKNIEISKELNTAESIILLQGGERSIITYHGAINKFSLDNIDARKLKAKWWYVSLPGESYKSFDKLLSFAKRNGIKIALNPSGHQLYGDGKEYLIKHISDVDVLLVNEKEASLITEVDFVDESKMFRKLDEMVKGIAVVTMGNRGATVFDGKYVYKAGIFKNNIIADRTGAGDAFGSGFVSGILEKNEDCQKGICDKDNIVYAIRFASANATSVVESIGAVDGILKKDEFIKSKRWDKLDINIIKIK